MAGGASAGGGAAVEARPSSDDPVAGKVRFWPGGRVAVEARPQPEDRTAGKMRLRPDGRWRARVIALLPLRVTACRADPLRSDVIEMLSQREK